MSQPDSRALADLHPHVAELCHAHIAACAADHIQIIVTFTLRSMATQGALYAQGRTAPGKIVTNAKPGESFHNYGLAYDVVPLDAHGHDDFDDVSTAAVLRWIEIGKLGKALGLRWGGDFHSIKDRPHFEWSGTLTLHDLQQGKRP
jgi:peptidoglycan L-alanyl-D-glutamate endopeptidase CwlK